MKELRYTLQFKKDLSSLMHFLYVFLENFATSNKSITFAKS